MNTTTKTVRLPSPVVAAAEQRAQELGMNFTHITEVALRKLLDLEDDPGFELVMMVRDRLLAQYPDKAGFPQEVTLGVFHQIRDTDELASLYRRAINSSDDPKRAAGSLHRRIGKTVRLALAARVVGRSLPLDPAEHLIKTHALLAPVKP